MEQYSRMSSDCYDQPLFLNRDQELSALTWRGESHRPNPSYRKLKRQVNIDALDLWGVILSVKIHNSPCQHYLRCSCNTDRTPRTFEDCPAALISGGQLFVRNINSKTRRNSWLLWSLRLLLLIFPPFLVLAGLCFFVLVFAINGITGGAFLIKIQSDFPGWLLARGFSYMDKHLCGVVVAGELPCIIPSNPDVAGIGVSLS